MPLVLVGTLVFLGLGFAPPAHALPLLANGGFETGDFTGWTVFDQAGGTGSFFIQSGMTSPLSSTAVPAPPGGTFGAMTDSFGAGSHILYQDFTVPAGGVLSFDLFIGNRVGSFFTPASLAYDLDIDGVTGFDPNQQARVDLMNPAAALQSVLPGDVILNLFQTNVGDPLISGYNTFLFDLSGLAGQTVRLRFAEVDNQNFFQFGVDNVSLGAPIPEPGTLLLIGSGLVGIGVGARRRNRK